MSTSISTLGAGGCAASELYTKRSALSETTIAKLQALGIAVTDGMTEAQAQAKIAQAEAKQQPQNNSQQQNSSEREILSRAKTLASKVGVTVSSDADVSEILSDIETQLKAMMAQAQGNPSETAVVSSYCSELSSLKTQYSAVQSSQQTMYAAMDVVSASNKIALGLS